MSLVRSPIDSSCIDSLSTVIEQPSQLILSNIDTTNLICNNIANGEILITATGGSPEYSYSIDGGYTSQSISVFSDLESGNYSLLIEDEDGCTVSESIFIDEWLNIIIILET